MTQLRAAKRHGEVGNVKGYGLREGAGKINLAPPIAIPGTVRVLAFSATSVRILTHPTSVDRTRPTVPRSPHAMFSAARGERALAVGLVLAALLVEGSAFGPAGCDDATGNFPNIEYVGQGTTSSRATPARPKPASPKAPSTLAGTFWRRQHVLARALRPPCQSD